MSKPTLLEQLALLSNPAPTEFDPENAYSSLNASKSLTRDETREADEEGETQGEGEDDARGHYVQVGPSSLRKSVEDKEKEREDMAKYGGERRTRKQIFEDDDDEEEEEEEEEDEIDEEEEDEDEDEIDEEEEDEIDQEEEDDDDDDEDDPMSNDDNDDTPASPPRQSLETTQILSSLRSSISSDVTKGLAVKRQLDLFESLMPVRIRLQKGLLATDELLQGVDDGGENQHGVEALLKGQEGSEEERKLVQEIQEELKALSEGLFELREGLSTINTPDLPFPSPTKRLKQSHPSPSSPSSSSSSSSDYFPLASLDALTLSDATHPNLLSTLSKWSSKILAAQGLSSLLPRDKFRAVKVGAVEQIGATLAKRAREIDQQPKPSGSSGIVEGEKEFYATLVRDVIERKGGGGLDSISSSAPPLPNRLPKSARQKASIDTRASKGRKLRFTPQEKIQNFMVPVKMEGVGGGWHEEQVDELFASLLGKKMGRMEEEDGEEVGQREEEIKGLGGLRVF